MLALLALTLASFSPRARLREQRATTGMIGEASPASLSPFQGVAVDAGYATPRSPMIRDPHWCIPESARSLIIADESRISRCRLWCSAWTVRSGRSSCIDRPNNIDVEMGSGLAAHIELPLRPSG